jgi:phosphoribosylformylglycinamidine synthase
MARRPISENRCVLRSVKIGHTESPWLAGMGGEVETVPAPYQDGNVHMLEALFKELLSKGQIAAQYINGKPACPVESMVSENGRVLGRAGHVENLEKGLYINVFKAEESRIFANAVRYIKHRRL